MNCTPVDVCYNYTHHITNTQARTLIDVISIELLRLSKKKLPKTVAIIVFDTISAQPLLRICQMIIFYFAISYFLLQNSKLKLTLFLIGSKNATLQLICWTKIANTYF